MENDSKLEPEYLKALTEYIELRNKWIQSLRPINKNRKFKPVMNFVRDICEMLGIIEPLITPADPCLIEKLLGPGTVATFVEEDYQIIIPDTIEPEENTLEFWFQLSHELRHAWQATVGRNHFSNSYNEEAAYLEWENNEYELDANAFAIVAIKLFFDETIDMDPPDNPELGKKIKALVDRLSRQYK